MHLESRLVGPGGRSMYYRPDSSDFRVIDEVILNRIYRRVRAGFDVEHGEHWIDLGANIGAFAVYCELRGATAECYEPDPNCFKILLMNAPSFLCHNVAVTGEMGKSVHFWKGRLQNDYYRATAYPTPGLPEHPDVYLKNRHGAFLKLVPCTGVKMDIEGAEAVILDNEWLPKSCTKLCMEYHSSRDPSVENLKRRLDYLKRFFRHVQYPPEFDRLIASGEDTKTYFDRMIFAWS